MIDLIRRPAHTVCDHFLRILAARVKAMLQLGHGRWKQKDGDEMLAEVGLELARALPVDVEENVAALAKRLLHGRLGSSVAIAEDVGPFDELAGFDHSIELAIVDEMIIDALLLAWPHRPGRG